jgi:hypothetical protein
MRWLSPRRISILTIARDAIGIFLELIMKCFPKILLFLILAQLGYAFASANVVEVSNGGGPAGSENNIISVGLKNEIPVRAVQLQIADMPDLLQPDSVWIVSRGKGFAVYWNEDSGFLNIILLSFDSTLRPDSSAILRIGYSVSDKALNGQILDLVVTKAIITDIANESLDVEAEFGEFTVGDASAVTERSGGVDSYCLEQNYPNPFNPGTTIGFSVPRPEWVRLEIFNSLGQRIRTLLDAPVASGRQALRWDGLDEYGIQVAAGRYFYRIKAGQFVATKSLMLIK